MRAPNGVVRLGIIGCGRVAEERHLRTLMNLPEIRVVATADLNAERSALLGARLQAAYRFADYRAVLDRGDVDAVVILTPTASHAEIASSALEAGKHVLVEKPLALSLAECDRLAARAAESTRKVVVGFNLRWHRLVRRTREFIACGAIGRIKAIRSTFTHCRTGEGAPDWHRELNRGGGVSFNEAIHHFDLWRHLSGEDVERIDSVSEPSSHYEDETSAVVARLTGGVLATGVFSFRTGPTSEVELYGDTGRLCLSLYRFDGLELFPSSKYPGDLRERFKKALTVVSTLPGAIAASRRGGDFQMTFDGLWRHFVDCILHNRPSECTVEDGRSSVRIALAAVQAARSGSPVELPGE